MFGAGGTESYADLHTTDRQCRLAGHTASPMSTDTFGNLDTFKKHGGKLLTMVGAQR